MTTRRWARLERLLARRYAPQQLRPILGDLAEEYEQRLRADGRIRARLWLAREAWSLARAYGFRRDRPVTRRRSSDALVQDLRHAWRAMRARPAASAAVVVVLALGIGLVSAVFALADPFLFRPLPYAHPESLAILRLRPAARSSAPTPTLAEWDARRDLFSGVAAADDVRTVAPADGDVLRLQPVSAQFFDVLGVPVRLPAEWTSTAPGTELPVMLTAAAERRLFADRSAVGSLLRGADPAGGGYRVAGILPDSFLDPLSLDTPGRVADGFIPLADQPLFTVHTTARGYSSSSLTVIARLHPGRTLDAVSAALSTGTVDEHGFPTGGLRVSAERPGDRAAERVRPLAHGAMAAGVLIMLVCATNVGTLLLARGAARRRELGAREALGASRIDIARLLLVELLVMTTAGIGGGIALAKGALVAAAVVMPAEYTALGAPAVTLRVVACACAAGVAVVLVGLVPAWMAWRLLPRTLFGPTRDGEHVRVRVLRFAMVLAQTAVAVLLLVGAMLVGRSFGKLLTQDPGYDGDVVTVGVFYPSDRPADLLRGDIEATLSRLGRLPGVLRTATYSGTLVNGIMSVVGASRAPTIDGRPVAGARGYGGTAFFETIGARVVAGQLPSDDQASRSVVVNESFARECCESAARSVGVVLVDPVEGPLTISAVVKDLFTAALDQPPGPVLYLPSARASGFINYVLRLRQPDAALAARVQREIRSITPDARLLSGATMRRRLMQSVNDRTFATLFVLFFSVAAIAMAGAGIMGVVSSAAARRTRELAIRIAIGATPAHVWRLVAGEAIAAATVGSALGIVAALWWSGALGSQLYGITPTDPLSIAAAVLLASALVLAAAWLPSRRAIGLAPTTALRQE